MPCNRTQEKSTAVLVKLVRQGDADAFEALWAASRSRVHSVVRAYIANPADQEDLVQDILLKAFQALDSLREAEQFHPWLDACARRRCVDFLRRRGRVAFQSLDAPADPEEVGSTTEYASEDVDVEDLVITRSIGQAAQRSLEGMTELSRRCYALRTNTATPLREIAEILGTTEGAVKSMVYRVRRSLEADLQPFLAA